MDYGPSKTPTECGMLQHIGSLINDEICAREIKSNFKAFNHFRQKTALK